MNERLEAVISGRVQRVMYRDSVARKARSLGLVGEVKNVKDGSVRVVAEGSRGALQQLIVKLERGSLFSRVENVLVEWLPARGGYTIFDIAYD